MLTSLMRFSLSSALICCPVYDTMAPLLPVPGGTYGWSAMASGPPPSLTTPLSGCFWR